MSKLKDYTEFLFAAIRTIAAVAVVTYMVITPKPLAIIVPGPYPEYTMPLNMTYIQETIPDYGDREERNRVQEYEVQVTGGEFSRLDQRNLYEEVRDHYYIVTRNCNADALMDFATVRIYPSNYMEIEFQIPESTCTIAYFTYTRPKPEDIPFP